MNSQQFSEFLINNHACYEAVVWVREHNYDLETAWRECGRPDWMLWLAAKRGIDRRLFRAARAFARTALPYVPLGDDRPRLAIEAAESWTRGEATIDEVKRAAHAASYAADYREMCDLVRGIIPITDLVTPR